MANNTVPPRRIARVEIDRELCIGAATCLAVAPDYYELDEENKAIIKPGATLDDETLKQSAIVCPVKAILLYGEDGQQITP